MPVAEYQLLPPSVDSLTKKYELDTLHDVDTENPHSKELAAASRRAKLLGICFGLSFAVNIMLLSLFATNGWKIPVLLRKGEQWAIWRGAAPVYSPASGFITHKLKLSDRFTQASDYNGPRTKTRDHLWESLYLPYSPAAVPRWMAEPLLNHTERVQDDTERLGEPRYIIDLDVFHQLHCLVRASYCPA
ncbi:hypothetical protein DL93DRAFT_102863 [Clavulina sp. PMI_390]|nr:hypothetical protein DL93DRAFT_102863 [Clavulina sp. PMI_390]